MKMLAFGLVIGVLTALGLAGCSNGPALKQGDCVVIGSGSSIHQVSCQHPPQPQIYYVAQVTTGSCTVTADNEVTQGGDTLCLRQIYDTAGESSQPTVAPPPSSAPAQQPLPSGAKYLGPITQQDIANGDCTGVGRDPILREHNAYGWVCGQRDTTSDDLPVSMDQVCQYMYGYPSEKVYAPDAVARFRNYSAPYSWACYGTPTKAP